MNGSYIPMGELAADMSDRTFWGNFSDMSKNIVNNLIAKVPDIAVGTLTTMVDQKLKDKLIDQPEEKKTVTKTVVEREIVQQPGQTVYVASRTDWKQYLPFAIGGVAILGGVAFLAKSRRGRRR